MLDIKFIRNYPDKVKEALKAKNDPFDLNAFLALDAKRREYMARVEQEYARQNQLNAQMKQLLKEKKDASSVIEGGRAIKKGVEGLKRELNELDKKFHEQVLRIPNIPHESVPRGDVSHNQIIKEWGKKRKYAFTLLNHIALAEKLDIIDFKAAAKVSGSNFPLFKGQGARLVRALINFMIDVHTRKHGYIEIAPPYLVSRDSMTATGQLPKLEEDMYKLKDDDLFLIPTAEVPLTNILRDEVVDESVLPLFYVAYTACFRREAGSYGRESRGLMRVHQFNKVELVKFTKPNDSYQEHEKLLEDACRVIELLDIPYRVVLLASADLSFAGAKCYDIEIYAPGSDAWLEVSSVSNFEDFQARRGNIRYRDSTTKKLEFVHTLNGSGVALARLIVCLLENYQQDDGTVIVPKALREYYDGEERISR